MPLTNAYEVYHVVNSFLQSRWIALNNNVKYAPLAALGCYM